jgi:hypothetical protein
MLFSKEKSKYNIPSFSILDEHIIRLKQLSNTFGLSSYSLIRSKMKAILSDAICMIETWKGDKISQWESQFSVR